jgi:hypothetical protein
VINFSQKSHWECRRDCSKSESPTTCPLRREASAAKASRYSLCLHRTRRTSHQQPRRALPAPARDLPESLHGNPQHDRLGKHLRLRLPHPDRSPPGCKTHRYVPSPLPILPKPRPRRHFRRPAEGDPIGLNCYCYQIVIGKQSLGREKFSARRRFSENPRRKAPVEFRSHFGKRGNRAIVVGLLGELTAISLATKNPSPLVQRRFRAAGRARGRRRSGTCCRQSSDPPAREVF